MTTPIEWIAVDWGTSNLRLWGITAEGEVAFSVESEKGMGRITPADYPKILNDLLAGKTDGATGPIDVIVCGMAGARQGWMEAPYAETPAVLEQLGQKAVSPTMTGGRLKPRIISGVCQKTLGHEDVMRGEETQILGLLELNPDFEGTVCMPGTHSKWVRVDNGAIKSFGTVMTGELFELLSKHSVLRHSMPEEPKDEDTEKGVADGLQRGLSEPQLLTSNLFSIRASSLLTDKSAHWCAGYLSGLLVGSEVAAHRNWLDDTPVQLIGSERLCRVYGQALNMAGAESRTISVSVATLAGLTAARRHMQ